jgi:hypothetical protein
MIVGGAILPDIIDIIGTFTGEALHKSNPVEHHICGKTVVTGAGFEIRTIVVELLLELKNDFAARKSEPAYGFTVWAQVRANKENADDICEIVV